MESTEPQDADSVWFHMIRLHGRMSAAMNRRLREINLSIPQCDVLTALIEHEGISQQDLAQRLMVTKGNVSGLIDRLVIAGLVDRRTLNSDRRTHAIHLTPEGRRLALQGIAMQKAFVNETLGRLSPAQLAQMTKLLVLARGILQQQEGVSSRSEAAT